MAGWWYGFVCSQIGNPLIPPGNMIAVNWDMHHVQSGETGAAETVLWFKIYKPGFYREDVGPDSNGATWRGRRQGSSSFHMDGKSNQGCWLVLIGTWNCWSCLLPDSMTLIRWLDNSHVFNIAWRRLKSLELYPNAEYQWWYGLYTVSP